MLVGTGNGEKTLVLSWSLSFMLRAIFRYVPNRNRPRTAVLVAQDCGARKLQRVVCGELRVVCVVTANSKFLFLKRHNLLPKIESPFEKNALPVPRATPGRSQGASAGSHPASFENPYELRVARLLHLPPPLLTRGHFNFFAHHDLPPWGRTEPA